jgi:hypothetical protein
MASIRVQGRRLEIRECRSTDRGPRQAVLASFSGMLTPEVLDQAEGRARRPFDREAVIARARRMGIPVTRRRRYPEARALLASLQRGGDLDPRLVTLLRDALAALPAEPVPEHLAQAVQWVGTSEIARGRALRGLLRTADRILQSRGPLRSPPARPFPRFRSRPEPA